MGGGMAIALFSYLGVETAAVAAAKVRDPDRNIPRSTIFGTLATAVVYMLSLTPLLGILPATTLAKSSAPFSDAANVIFGGTWAGKAMAVAVIISGFGALTSWTMICAEMPLAAAKDGLFPERFKRMTASGVPCVRDYRLHCVGVHRHPPQLPGLLPCRLFRDAGADDRNHRRHPLRVLRAGPAQMAVDDHKATETPRLARDVVVAALSLFWILFIVYSRNTGNSFWAYWAPFFLAGGALLLGVPVYLAQRRHMTQPQSVPPYR